MTRVPQAPVGAIRGRAGSRVVWAATALRAARARGCQRRDRATGRATDGGVVLVESLLVVSTLVLLFIGFVYVDNVYERELQVLRASRAYGIAYALGACDEDPKGLLAPEDAATLTPGSLNGGASALGSPGKGGDPAADRALGEATSRSGLTLPREVTTRAAAAVAGPIGASAQPGGSFHTTLLASDHVLCGDKSHDEGIVGMVELALDFFRMK